MPLNAVIREKRKALGLTQEQLAEALGVTTPAVNKWERGNTCPDLGLLPALARVLKTDPNTLLSFQDSLSQQEIALFLNELSESLCQGGVEQCFDLAMEKVREYPNCPGLLHVVALSLDGALMMSQLTAQQKKPYQDTVLSLYERLAKGEDPDLSIQANYMLASKLIEEGFHDQAQEKLDQLPDWNGLDKRGMQARLWGRQGELEKARQLLERKLATSVQDHQSTMCQLIQLAVQAGDASGAKAWADCASKECEAFEMGLYWANLAPLEVAVAQRDKKASIQALTVMLDAATRPWEFALSPLFSFLPRKEGAKEMGVMFLKPLLTTLEQEEQYAFLQGEAEYEQLLAPYRAMCNNQTAQG